MMGWDGDGYAEIATKRGAAAQVFASALSASSITTKSAVSTFSTICTRTVAVRGSSVKATCRSACQGAAAICSDDPPASMQGRGPGNNSPPANTPARIRGTADARIFKRNITRHSPSSALDAAHGWQSVKKTRYRRVDGAVLVQRAPGSGGISQVLGQRPVGQRLSQMQPADLGRAVEVGQRARHA